MNIQKKNFVKEGDMFMLNEEICKLREKLNNSILEGQEYEKIYKISVELDNLIAQFYKV